MPPCWALRISFPPETAPAAAPAAAEESGYRGTGSGRKESPFADSPYVMNHPPVEPARKQKAPRAPKKNNGAGKKILCAVLALVLLAGSCGITAILVNSRWQKETAKMETSFQKQLDDLQKQITDTRNRQTAAVRPAGSGEAMNPSGVYAACVDSVVAISVTVQSNMYGQSVQGTGSGSGFILTENGYVITNAHVVDGASAVTVITHGGTEYPAEIVGTDATNDVAVLKVDATGLPAVTVGSSNDLAIGDMVVAIGNPLGELSSTQTVGYVSGKERDVTTDGTIMSMIQTDAAINSGNSGGPLFNMYGEVVGITTAKYSGTTNSGASIEGIGFAIPIDDVSGILADLMDYGYVTGAYLGVVVQNTDEASAAMFGLPVGAYVVSVEPGYAAERAGIQPKDMIIGLGGKEITGITSLTRALRAYKAGDTTQITILRGGRELVLDITLDEKPQQTQETTAP